MWRAVHPVKPNRGLRGTDSWGSGSFGASRDGGSRRHRGTDYTGRPGDFALAPIGGRIAHVGLAKRNTMLGSIHIEGMGEYAGAYVKIYYARPMVEKGDMVAPGEVVGAVQDVADYYHLTAAERPGPMTNHIHVEMREYIDPEKRIEELL